MSCRTSSLARKCTEKSSKIGHGRSQSSVVNKVKSILSVNELWNKQPRQEMHREESSKIEGHGRTQSSVANKVKSILSVNELWNKQPRQGNAKCKGWRLELNTETLNLIEVLESTQEYVLAIDHQ